MNGAVKNDFLRGMVPNEWKWVSIIHPIKKNKALNPVELLAEWKFEKMADLQTVYMSGMKLEIFDDKPQELFNRYAQSKKIGEAPNPKGTVSRSSYYTPKRVSEALNTQTLAKK